MKTMCEALGPFASCGQKGTEWYKKGDHPLADTYWVCKKHYDKAVEQEKSQNNYSS